MIRMYAVAIACALATTGLARAEDGPLPDLFDVTGVAAADALNVRSAPDAGAEMIGRLTPDATGVEVTAIDGGWGRINEGERSGWAAMRFLERQAGTWTEGKVPTALVCFGTEPFWSFGFEDDNMVWSSPEEMIWMETAEALGGAVSGDVRRGVVAAGDGMGIHAIIAPGACSDGMSDRAFGLTAGVILNEGEGPRLRHGCCSIAP